MELDWIGAREVRYGDILCTLKILGVPAFSDLDIESIRRFKDAQKMCGEEGGFELVEKGN